MRQITAVHATGLGSEWVATRTARAPRPGAGECWARDYPQWRHIVCMQVSGEFSLLSTDVHEYVDRAAARPISRVKWRHRPVSDREFPVKRGRDSGRFGVRRHATRIRTRPRSRTRGRSRIRISAGSAGRQLCCFPWNLTHGSFIYCASAPSRKASRHYLPSGLVVGGSCCPLACGAA